MHASMTIQYAAIVITFTKIGLEKRGHTLGFGALGVLGFGVGLMVRIWSSVSAESFSDDGVDLVASGKGTLVWCRGRIGFALVDVVLVLARILSGPCHQVGLGIRE